MEDLAFALVWILVVRSLGAARAFVPVCGRNLTARMGKQKKSAAITAPYIPNLNLKAAGFLAANYFLRRRKVQASPAKPTSRAELGSGTAVTTTLSTL
mgnify:CR=1 FL=1